MKSISKKYGFGTVIKLMILIGILLLTGCQGSFTPPEEKGKPEIAEPEAEPAPEKEFAYDPLNLSRDRVIVPEVFAHAVTGGGDSAVSIEPALSDDSLAYPTGAYESYRIQLFTSKEYGPAYREQLIAQEVFDRKVWFDYEVPYYKVRVGDFRNRPQAEKYLPAAREAGYKTAWVVKVNINVKSMEDIYETELPPVIDSLEEEYMNRQDDEANESDSLEYEPENPQN